MKILVMAAAALAVPALSAEAQEIRVRDRWSSGSAPRHEQVLVGYRDEIVGYEDVWVQRPATTYEMRTVYRRVFVGYDPCRRPIYRTMPVCEQVPVYGTRRVWEKRPICEKRPVYETREVVCHKTPRSRWGFSFLFGR